MKRPIQGFRMREPLPRESLDPHGDGDAVANQPTKRGLPSGQLLPREAAEVTRSREPGRTELALGEPSRSLPRRQAAPAHGERPLREVPQPLAAVTACNGDPPLAPQDLE